MEQVKRNLVWDFPTRVFHWLLALSVAAQWYTGEQGDDWLEWHFYIGYFVLSLLLFRIVWGFVGTRYARFSDFLVAPKTMLNYLKGKHPTSVGHPPLGGLMVLFFLGLLLVQGITGLFTTDEIFTDGPWRSVLSGDMQDLADWVHGNLFGVIQLAIFIHIAAAFYYLFFRKLNLITPMLHGYKNVSSDQGITDSKWLKGLIILVAAVVVIALVVWLAPEAQEDDYY